jgi:hypothetical protein
MRAPRDEEYLTTVYMEITLSTEALRDLSNTTLLRMAIVGYVVGAVMYYVIKGRFVGKLLTEQIQFFGSLSRVTHVIGYMFLGYVFPDRFIIVMLLGAGWEMVEWTLASLMQDPYWGIGQDYARDIIANAVGFLVGYLFHQVSSSSGPSSET